MFNIGLTVLTTAAIVWMYFRTCNGDLPIEMRGVVHQEQQYETQVINVYPYIELQKLNLHGRGQGVRYICM